MRRRSIRIWGTTAAALTLLTIALVSTLSVTATGTGTCDPFDLACLRNTNLTASDVCAVNDQECIRFYQLRGLTICPTNNTTCQTQYASLLLGTTIPGATPVPINQYGINICSQRDYDCLRANQAKGIPICPPDDYNCLDSFAALAPPIPTYGTLEQTPTYLPRTGISDGNRPGSVGVIVRTQP